MIKMAKLTTLCCIADKAHLIWGFASLFFEGMDLYTIDGNSISTLRPWSIKRARAYNSRQKDDYKLYESCVAEQNHWHNSKWESEISWSWDMSKSMISKMILTSRLNPWNSSFSWGPASTDGWCAFFQELSWQNWYARAGMRLCFPF